MVLAVGNLANQMAPLPKCDWPGPPTAKTSFHGFGKAKKADIFQSCPSECRCDINKDRVFCHNRGLVRIPKNIPRDTTQLVNTKKRSNICEKDHFFFKLSSNYYV